MTNARTAKSTREKAAQLRQQELARQARRRNLIVLAVVTVVAAIVVGIFVLVQDARRDQQAALGRTPANLGPENSFVVGSDQAPVTLTVYEDFLCPVCRSFEEANRDQIAQWVEDETVQVQYRPVAFLNRLSADEYSTRSLNAAAAVLDAAPEAIKQYLQLLYDNQPAEGGPGLTDSVLIDLAVQAGAPRDKVAPAIETRAFEGWTARVTEAASKADVTGTPTLLVNGTTVESQDQNTPAWSPEVVKAAVEKAAAEAKKK